MLSILSTVWSHKTKRVFIQSEMLIEIEMLSTDITLRLYASERYVIIRVCVCCSVRRSVLQCAPQCVVFGCTGACADVCVALPYLSSSKMKT